TNAGPSSANNAVFTDPAVTGLSATSVTCGSATGSAACPTPGNTTVALMQGAGIVIPTLPSGGSVTFTLTESVTATSGSVTNTAFIVTPAGTSDPNAANNSQSDTDAIDTRPTAVANTTNVTTAGGSTYTFTVTYADD